MSHCPGCKTHRYGAASVVVCPGCGHEQRIATLERDLASATNRVEEAEGNEERLRERAETDRIEVEDLRENLDICRGNYKGLADESDTLRVQLAESQAEVTRLRELAGECLSEIEKGRKGHFGTWMGYSPQINVSLVERWRHALAPKETL